MNSVTRSITFFTCGAIVASLPWLLSNKQTVAQGGQARDSAFAGAGPAPQGFPGNPPQPNAIGQGMQPRQFGGAPVNTIAFHGEFMFVGAGDTVYKIDHKVRGNEPMRIISSLRLGPNMGLPGRAPGLGAPPQQRGGGGTAPSGR